jgi:hypothetical protein
MNEDQEKLQSEETEGEELKVPLKFGIPQGMSSRYAHHLIVQPNENEVILSFFEVIPPLLLGNPEEQLEILKKGVRADCVARITVAKSRYPDFVRAMGSILEEPAKAEAPPKAEE